MGSIRMPMTRAEISHNFDHDESASIFTLRYNPEHASMFRPSNIQADETGVSNKPLKIYSYDFTVASTTLCQAFQYYGDFGDYAALSNWDLNNDTFVRGLKQHRLVAGHTGRYVTDWDAAFLSDHYVADSIQDTLDWKITTIRFRARWNKRKNEWGIPPITLSNGKKDYIGWSVANVGTQDNRKYYAILTIKKWKQVV